MINPPGILAKHWSIPNLKLVIFYWNQNLYILKQMRLRMQYFFIFHIKPSFIVFKGSICTWHFWTWLEWNLEITKKIKQHYRVFLLILIKHWSGGWAWNARVPWSARTAWCASAGLRARARSGARPHARCGGPGSARSCGQWARGAPAGRRSRFHLK